MLKKICSNLIILVLLLTLFGGNVLAKETISFQGWIGMEESGVESWELMKSSFEENNPNVNIKYIGVPWAQMLQQITISARGGNPPDLAQLNAGWMVQLAEMGVLEPLDDHLTDKDLEGIPQAVLDSGMYKDKLYSIPWAPGPIVVFGRKDLMEKAGLDFENGPENWKEFENMIAKINDLEKTEDGKNIYGFSMRTKKGSNTGQWFLPILWAYGGNVLDKDGNVVFNSPETVKALSWVKEISENRAIREGTDSTMSRNIFANGQAGFIFDGPWLRGIMEAKTDGKLQSGENFKAYIMPPGVSDKSKTIANNHVLVMFKESENKEESLKFMKHLIQNKNIANTYREKAGYLNPYEDYYEMSAFKNDNIFLEQMDDSDAVPIKVPESEQILEEISVALQRAILGQNPEKIAKNTAEKLNQIIE